MLLLDNLCIVHLQYWSAPNVYYTIEVRRCNANFTGEMTPIFKKSVSICVYMLYSAGSVFSSPVAYHASLFIPVEGRLPLVRILI